MAYTLKQIVVGVLLMTSAVALPTVIRAKDVGNLSRRSNLENPGSVGGILNGVAGIVGADTGTNAAGAAKGGNTIADGVANIVGAATGNNNNAAASGAGGGRGRGRGGNNNNANDNAAAAGTGDRGRGDNN